MARNQLASSRADVLRCARRICGHQLGELRRCQGRARKVVQTLANELVEGSVAAGGFGRCPLLHGRAPEERRSRTARSTHRAGRIDRRSLSASSALPTVPTESTPRDWPAKAALASMGGTEISCKDERTLGPEQDHVTRLETDGFRFTRRSKASTPIDDGEELELAWNGEAQRPAPSAREASGPPPPFFFDWAFAISRIVGGERITAHVRTIAHAIRPFKHSAFRAPDLPLSA